MTGAVVDVLLAGEVEALVGAVEQLTTKTEVPNSAKRPRLDLILDALWILNTELLGGVSEPQ